MGIFLVTAINDPSKVEASIKAHFNGEYYQVPHNNAWFVVFNGTTKELSDKIGLTNAANGTGVVIAVSNYYGRAPTDMWEWLKTRVERA